MFGRVFRRVKSISAYSLFPPTNSNCVFFSRFGPSNLLRFLCARVRPDRKVILQYLADPGARRGTILVAVIVASGCSIILRSVVIRSPWPPLF